MMSYAIADISIVKKGDWVVMCGSIHISNHDRYDKAIQSAINQNKDCDIIPPLRVEIRWIKDKPDILLTWDIPTEREDGSKIQSIDRFNIYIYFNTVLQDVIEVSGNATVFQLPQVKAGNYAFQISTVENGLEGKLSDFVTVTALEKAQASPVKIDLTDGVIE